MQVLPHKGFVYIENEKAEEDSSGIYVPVETVKGPISRGVIVSVHSSSTVMTVGRRVAFIADKAMRQHRPIPHGNQVERDPRGGRPRVS